MPFQRRIAYLYNNTKMSDFNFIVGTTQTAIPGHKFLFSVLSEFFYDKFYGTNNKDGDGTVLSTTDEIYVPHINPYAFMEFLKYVYRNEILLTSKSVGDMLQLSTDFNINCLKEICIQHLYSSLYPQNSLFVLDLSIDYNLFELKDKCLEIIGINSDKIFKDSDFFDINEDTLKIILKSNHFICSEYDLFMGAIIWAQSSIKVRDIKNNSAIIKKALNNIWCFIRFNNMSINDLLKCLEYKFLLPNDEIQLILNLLKQNNKINKIRKELSMNFKFFNRFQSISYNLIKNNTKSSAELYFSVSEPIYCYGFGIYGPTVNGLLFIKSQIATATLLNCNCSEVKVKTLELNYDGSNKIYNICFDNPIKLISNGFYYVIINFDNTNDIVFEKFCGIKLADEINIDEIVVKFRRGQSKYDLGCGSDRFAGVLLRKFIE